MVKVRIKKALPKFIGDQVGTVYGPYDPGDVADVSPTIADILVFRDLAEYVEEEKEASK